jgi:hypothetical protein
MSHQQQQLLLRLLDANRRASDDCDELPLAPPPQEPSSKRKRRATVTGLTSTLAALSASANDNNNNNNGDVDAFDELLDARNVRRRSVSSGGTTLASASDESELIARTLSNAESEYRRSSLPGSLRTSSSRSETLSSARSESVSQQRDQDDLDIINSLLKMPEIHLARTNANNAQTPQLNQPSF